MCTARRARQPIHPRHRYEGKLRDYVTNMVYVGALAFCWKSPIERIDLSPFQWAAQTDPIPIWALFKPPTVDCG